MHPVSKRPHEDSPSTSDQEEEGSGRQKRRNYGLGFKLEAIEYAEEFSKRRAARDLGVSKSRIQAWCKQKADLVRQQ